MSAPPPQGFPLPQKLWENLTLFFFFFKQQRALGISSLIPVVLRVLGSLALPSIQEARHPTGTPRALARTILHVPLPLLRVMKLGFSVGSWREPMWGGFLTCGEGWLVGGPELADWSPKHLPGREWGL